MTIGLYLLILTAASYADPLSLSVLPEVNTIPISCFVLNAEEQPLVNVDEDIADEWFAMDKFWHWSMSFALVGASYHLANVRLGQEKDIALLEALSFTLVCGLAKEFYDLYNEKLFSFKDLLYDVLGIAAGYFVFIYP